MIILIVSSDYIYYRCLSLRKLKKNILLLLTWILIIRDRPHRVLSKWINLIETLDLY